MLDILIVEDNKEIGTLLCDFLRKENYTVSVAHTGEKALELYEKYGAKVIVLDIMLPGMDGFAVCSKIRETSNIHILIASAKVEKNDKLKETLPRRPFMSEKTRIGIIGVGSIAQFHLQGYKDNPDVEIYALCDIDALFAKKAFCKGCEFAVSFLTEAGNLKK